MSSDPATIPHTTRARWANDEKDIVKKAYTDATDADDFVARLPKPPYPQRSLKGYLTYLYKEEPTLYHDPTKKALHDALNARHLADYKAIQAAEAAKVQPSLPTVDASPSPSPAPASSASWVDEIDGTTAPPSAPPLAAKPNFAKPQPDPNARVPRHYSFPPTKTHYSAGDIAHTFSVSILAVADAISRDKLPVVRIQDGLNGSHMCIAHEDFLVLHDAMCDGFTFDEACTKVKAKAAEASLRDFQEKNLMVPAQDLYTTAVVTGPGGDTKAVLTGPAKVMEAVFAPVEGETPAKAVPPIEIPVKAVEGASPAGPPRKLADKETNSAKVIENVRCYTLEAVRDKILLPTQAADILVTRDHDRTIWALTLLGDGKITPEQATKLIRWG